MAVESIGATVYTELNLYCDVNEDDITVNENESSGYITLDSGANTIYFYNGSSGATGTQGLNAQLPVTGAFDEYRLKFKRACSGSSWYDDDWTDAVFEVGFVYTVTSTVSYNTSSWGYNNCFQTVVSPTQPGCCFNLRRTTGVPVQMRTYNGPTSSPTMTTYTSRESGEFDGGAELEVIFSNSGGKIKGQYYIDGVLHTEATSTMDWPSLNHNVFFIFHHHGYSRVHQETISNLKTSFACGA